MLSLSSIQASYGSSNFIYAITQLSQTTLRSVIGKLELDKTFEERDYINHSIVTSLDQAAQQVEHLGLNGNGRRAAPQFAPVGIKHLVGKEKLHAD